MAIDDQNAASDLLSNASCIILMRRRRATNAKILNVREFTRQQEGERA